MMIRRFGNIQWCLILVILLFEEFHSQFIGEQLSNVFDRSRTLIVLDIRQCMKKIISTIIFLISVDDLFFQNTLDDFLFVEFRSDEQGRFSEFILFVE